MGAALAGLLALTGIIAGPTAALAAPGDDQVRIDDISFRSGEIEDWNWQRVDVKWSIDAEAAPPVALTIDLPEGLFGHSETFPVFGPESREIGECVVTATRVTCSIDDEFITENPFGVSGDFYFEVQTRLDNREAVERTFDIGGFENEVVVSPSRNWCVDDCEFGGYGQGKWGSYNTADDTIVWTVRLPAGPDGIAAGQEVGITDLLDQSAYELIADGTYPRVQEAGMLQYDRWGNEVVAGWSTRTAGVTWSDDRLTASFESREGAGSDWRNDVEAPTPGAQRGVDGGFYQVQWKVKALTGGELRPNGDRVFRNSAEWEIGSEASGKVDGSSTRSFRGGNAVGTNFGRFQVTKELTGDTTLNPAFTVDFTATEPGQAPVEGSFTLHSGENYTSPEFFRGTVVTLEEVLPAEPANVTWAPPVFLDADGEPADTITFTADGNGRLGSVTEIRLVNEATLQRAAAFSAKKALVNEGGVPLPGSTEFQLGYRYPANPGKGLPGGSGSLSLPVGGDIVSSGELPVGAELTLAEAGLPNVPGATWAAPVVTPSTLTVGADGAPVAVTVTNTITPDLGGFSVMKSISGTGAGLVPEDAEFTVAYEYDAVNWHPAGSGTVSFRADETATVEQLPAGAEVRLTELEVSTPEGGTWGDPEFSRSSFTVVKDTTVAIDLDNPISWNDGDFSVLKRIVGDGSDLVAAETAFTVDYSYVLPEALHAEPSTGSGTLTVRADGEAVIADPLPYGTEVTLSEATPADIPGGTWLRHEFDRPSFTIGDGTTLEVTLTNEIERDLGGFAVTKTVTGTGAELVDEGAEFTVNYSYPAGEWYDAGEGTLTVANGGTATVEGLPATAVVTLEEAAPKDPQNGRWVSAEFVGGDRVVIGKNETARVSLVNEVELGAGGFSVRKEVEGSGSGLVDEGFVFTVDYAYPAGPGFEAGSGTLEVTAGGAATAVDGIPAGAKVTLTERDPADIAGAAWTAHEFSPASFTIGDSEVIEVVLTNTLERDGALASTGGRSPLLWGIAAGALLLGGAALATLGRRRTRRTS